MTVETKAEKKKKNNMVQSLVGPCLPAYVALRCPFYISLIATLRCKALDQHKINNDNKKENKIK